MRLRKRRIPASTSAGTKPGSQLRLSPEDRKLLAGDLLGLMRNLWADETEEAIRAAQLAERTRVLAEMDAKFHELPQLMDPKGPTTFWGNSNKKGGCCFCNRHIQPHGETGHKVLCVHGPNLLVRFCEKCLATLRTATTK